MRTLLLGMIALAAMPASSIACTCVGTQSMTAALMTAEAVVVGRVKSRTQPSYSSKNPRPEALVVEVTDSLKGGLSGEIEIAEVLMCYQSFWGEDFKIGESYVFPLTEIDLANPDDTWGMMVGTIGSEINSYKMFVLPTCSHTALLLNNGKLYTNELTHDGGRRLAYYMHLSITKLLFRAEVFNVRGAIAGVVVLLLLSLGFMVARKRRAKTADV